MDGIDTNTILDLGYTKTDNNNYIKTNTDLVVEEDTISVPSEVKIMDRLQGIITNTELSSDQQCNEIHKIKDMVKYSRPNQKNP